MSSTGNNLTSLLLSETKMRRCVTFTIFYTTLYLSEQCSNHHSIEESSVLMQLQLKLNKELMKAHGDAHPLGINIQEC